MKKIFSLIFYSVLTAGGYSQTLNVFKTNAAYIPTLTITNGAVLNETTVSNSLHTIKILFKNTSVTTQTYTLYRTITFNTPPLDLTGGAIIPYTEFCFGYSAFPDNVNTPPPSDYTILGPAGSSTSPYDGNYANGNPFIIDLQEDVALGKYFVRYKLENITNANDTLSFTVKYNDTSLGFDQLNNAIGTVDIYPNPANKDVSLVIDMQFAAEIKIDIFNFLGSVIYNGTSTNYSSGKQKIPIDLSNFNSGLYLISVSAGEKKINKTLLLNK